MEDNKGAQAAQPQPSNAQAPTNDQPQPDNKPQDQPQIDYKKDIQGQSMRDVAEGVDMKPVEEIKKPEEPQKPAEEPKKEDEVPLEQVVKDTVKLTTEELRTQEEAAKQQPEPTPDEKLYIEWEKTFNQKNSRPPTYLEAMQFVTEQAVAKIRAEQAKEEEAKKVEAEKQTKAQAEETERLNKYVDDELDELYRSGKLSKIEDPNNPSDQGVVERRALFQTWKQVNDQRIAEGKPEILSATRIFDFYYKKPNAQPAGANAPVMGNRASSVAPSEELNYDYKDIRRPWSFFRQKPQSS